MIRQVRCQFLSLLLAVLVVGPTAALAAVSSPDGIWQVTLSTTTGNCHPSYVVTLIIERGELRSREHPNVVFTGLVGGSGDVNIGAKLGLDRARGIGALLLDQKHGNGNWNYDNGICEGTWTATPAQ